MSKNLKAGNIIALKCEDATDQVAVVQRVGRGSMMVIVPSSNYEERHISLLDTDQYSVLGEYKFVLVTHFKYAPDNEHPVVEQVTPDHALDALEEPLSMKEAMVRIIAVPYNMRNPVLTFDLTE